VRAYKDLSNVERAFRCIKTIDLEVRPIYHRRADRVRAHVMLCMLAYYLEWHMRKDLQPIISKTMIRPRLQSARRSIVAKAERSDAADKKAATKRTHDGLPVHSSDAARRSGHRHPNTMVMAHSPEATFVLYPKFTPLQERAFQLLGTEVRL